METATFVAIFISCLLISFTGYALYTHLDNLLMNLEIHLKNMKTNFGLMTF
ncbi:hypothetical protein Mapa_018805 [Marchantia paleacea]|nr:hypothetical protein Mapa_018805 [Marchantia paleacea]